MEIKSELIDINSRQERLNSLRRLYETSFPQEERIEFNDLMQLAKLMSLSITAYYLNDIFIGFTILHKRHDFNWFWYFAIEEDLRCKGYGQHILTEMLSQHNERPMIIDAESPFQEDCNNAKQRKRRYDFYLRNGFKDTGVGRTFEGVTYSILLHGEGSFTPNDYDLILAELRHHWSSMPSPQ